MRMVVDNISQKSGQKIHFIEQEKLGRSAAGNAGLAAAKGRWCLFLDDDDLLFADHIEILVNTLHAYPVAAAAYTLAWEVKTDKEKILSEGAYSEISHEVLPIMRQEFDHKVFWHHNFIPIQSVLFERRLFDERGGFELDMDALEDWVLWKKYAQGNQFHYVPKVTSMYRVPADPVDFERRMQVINDAYLTAVEKTDNTDLHIDEGR
jgi:glycosyltransferase involved in cell wall biosynthesis